jgi:hypothetical protein
MMAVLSSFVAVRLAASASVGPRLALGAAVGAAASLFKQCTDRVVASKRTPWPVVAVAVLKEYLRARSKSSFPRKESSPPRR